MSEESLLKQLASRARDWHTNTGITQSAMAAALKMGDANYSKFLSAGRSIGAEATAAFCSSTLKMGKRQAVATFTKPVLSSQILRLQEKGKAMQFDNGAIEPYQGSIGQFDSSNSGWVPAEGSNSDPNNHGDITSTPSAVTATVSDLTSVFQTLDHLTRKAVIDSFVKAHAAANSSLLTRSLAEGRNSKVPDYDLDDLLDRLNKVAADSNHDDDADINPDEDSDERDDREVDDEVGEDHDGFDEDDFSRPKVLNRIIILQRKLDEDAVTYSRRKQSVTYKSVSQDESKTQLNLSKIAKLRSRTADINDELATNKQLEQATKLNQQARAALYLANLTPEQKREHDEDVQRMAQHYSAICPEASPMWREDATAAFRNRRLT